MQLRDDDRIAWTDLGYLRRPAAAQQPVDPGKFPPIAGQWMRVGPLGFSTTPSPPGRGQQAPLTPEYQALFEANLARVAKGETGDDPVDTCIPEGMPRAMNLVLPMEFAITPRHHLHPDGISQHAAPHLYGWPRLSDR